MNSLSMIGAIAVIYLRKALASQQTDGGTSRFVLDRLTGAQIAEVCRAILQSDLAEHVEIKVRESLGKTYALPEHVLTAKGLVHWRHADCAKPALLIAGIDDNEEKSFGVLTPVGARDLKGELQSWVEIAAQDLVVPENHLKWCRQALKGLLTAGEFSLDQFAAYVFSTRRRMQEASVPIRDALGWSLPALGLPRDSGFFQAIPEKKLGQAAAWEKRFRDGLRQRKNLLLKQRPNGREIETEELQKAFATVRDEIPTTAHTVIEQFIDSAPGWHAEAEGLAELEWESDRVNALFDGMKTKSVDLGSLTVEFFEDEYPNELTQDETAYLENLKKRKTREPVDDDRDFYEKHRKELEADRSLKAKWDKFVYGQPIECTDFLSGLLAAVERLFERAGRPVGKKQLVINTSKGKSNNKWLEMNAEIGQYFCTRYRGLPELTAPEVEWETEKLFQFDEVLEWAREKGKKISDSSAKSATEIKFFIDLHYQVGLGEDNQSVQLIWRGNPEAIGAELHDDLERLAKAPLLLTEARRELVNKKGKLQGISLNDVTTLTAVYGKDCGSLVSSQKNGIDLAKTFPKALREAQQEQLLTDREAGEIEEAWQTFVGRYTQAIDDFANVGPAAESFIQQAEAYNRLLSALLKNAHGDRNRSNLLAPVLRIGCVRVTGGKPAAVIAPWHPLRLAAIAAKTRQTAGLLKHIIKTEQVDFGDQKLFFSDLREELKHPYYPEICVAYAGEEPKLLSMVDTVNDYSLMERPIRDQGDQPTNEDPTDAANRLLALTKRYLELLPHERTNLTVVLYNCDSTRLPQSVVTKLAEMEENEEEVRCQVTLRHQNTEKLNRLYREMIESFDADPDAYVASEMSRDYLAKLRIGVMADEAPAARDEKEGRVADIVFLQDVISRLAEEKWEASPRAKTYPSMLEHVPPRWSRKRVLHKGDLKSTAYLACPKQPEVGENYLQAVACVVNSQDINPTMVSLPVRQILFTNEKTSQIFDEVHRLGEWVVNYDSLLERRQLMNKGIKVIRYQQNDTDERNLLVSSKSSLNLLEVLVRRRLNDLNLGVSEQEIGELTTRFIKEANGISGDIVLRAAKRGRFASELLGVVLSKTLIAAEMGKDADIGWYFLDDYASWLGQREEQIADIMAICPKIVDGQRYLKIVVSEAKYISEEGLSEAKKNSSKQLWDTVRRIEDAVFGRPGRLDRDLWLSRISDIMLDGIEQASNSPIQIEEWRADLREGRLLIDLSGYSHVFISGPNGSIKGSEQIEIPKVNRCIQEIFSREQVRDLVLALLRKESVLKVREQLGAERPWEQASPQQPAEKTSWVIPVGSVNLHPAAVTHETEAIKNSFSGDGATVVTERRKADSEKTGSGELVNTPLPGKPSVAEFEPQPEAADTGKTIVSIEDWIQARAVKTRTDEAAERWLSETVQRLKAALISYEFQAQVLGQRLTPNAALIRLRGSDRLTIAGLEAKRTQLLTTHGLQIINIAAMPGEVLILIARPNRQVISLAEVWARRELNRTADINLSLVVGVKEVDGELLYLNFGGEFAGLQQHAPHTLIAGTTGSGKSVLVLNLILDICAFNSSTLAKIYLIDPKAGVDYFALDSLPHLAEGIITEKQRAIEVMESLFTEMERRYTRFAQVRVSNLMQHNLKVPESERLPVLWVVHDEFAEWMLDDEYQAAVSSLVQRLGAKARAAGIHLIFAAQRPDVNVFPMQLRDNLDNRLILKVASVGTSEIALKQKGAELLLGKGHLGANLPGEPSIIYAQVPFISSDEAHELVKLISQAQFRKP
jgi:S-DNA-T family DNA segregation ATPase FtsK/SpoIIIE